MNTLDSKELADALRNVIENAEALLRSTADTTGEKVAAARSQTERSLHTARKRLRHVERRVTRSARKAARQGERYVDANPWSAIGIAAGAGVVTGLLLSHRRAQHDSHERES